jgi:hypothetical protein
VSLFFPAFFFTDLRTQDLHAQHLPLGATDFTFLRPEAFIVGSAGSPGEIFVYTFERNRQNSPVHTATLLLPTLVANRIVERVLTHSGPFCARLPPERPFFKANDARICVVSLEYDVQEDDCCLYVHHRFLQTYAVQHKGAPVLVPWEGWGPHHTRLLPGGSRHWLRCLFFLSSISHVISPFFRYVHGERAITPRISSDFVGIMDFAISTRAGYYPDAEELPPHIIVKMCLGPSTMDKPELFARPVTTRLPYRSTARSMDSADDGYHIFMIDDERVIGVNRNVRDVSPFVLPWIALADVFRLQETQLSVYTF